MGVSVYQLHEFGWSMFHLVFVKETIYFPPADHRISFEKCNDRK